MIQSGRAMLKRGRNAGQSQEAGDDAINVQAGRDVSVSVGLSLADVRQVAMDVYRANFLELAGQAADIARDRVNDFVDTFTDTLGREAPGALEEMRNPDMQYALFTAQREFARSGEKDLGEMLVKLLVDRAKAKNQDLMRLVLNESINTAPKLTSGQLDALSTVFLFRYTRKMDVVDQQALCTYLGTYIKPFLDNVPRKQSNYQHLEYAGCATASIASAPAEDILKNTYPGLFCKGFSEEVARIAVDVDKFSSLLVPCLNDPQQLQIATVNDDTLQMMAGQLGATPDEAAKLRGLLTSHLLPADRVRAVVVGIEPGLEILFKVWPEAPLHNLNLTSVGIAIGQANARSKTGQQFDLSIWI